MTRTGAGLEPEVPAEPVDPGDPLAPGHPPAPGHPLDPLGLRRDAPLLDAYLRALTADRTPFTVPGHKGRSDLVGAVVAGDVPLHGGADTVRLDHGLLLDAERRAATLWGADWCRFSVGGSTHGNQALALSVGVPGDRVLVSRTLHRSMLSGLILAGLEPVWLYPWIDPVTGFPGGVTADAVRIGLRAHPDVRAVFVGDPSYVGGFGDVAAIAEVAHAHGIPLVVDAAWAAHFGFHAALPAHAIAQGADAMVISAHKTLPAMSQAAIVLADTRAGRLDPDRLDRGIETTHTTSPAGAIHASTDAARALLAHHGHRLLDRLVTVVADARDRLDALDGVSVLRADWIEAAKLVVRLDPDGGDDRPGPTGYDIERHLLAAGLPVEMVDRRTLIPMVTVADYDATVGRLVDAIATAITTWRRDADGSLSTRTPTQPLRRPAGRASTSTTVWTLRAETVMAPREAFFAPHRTVPSDDAVGAVSAELVAPYPPGIPVLAPGERITAAALDALRSARDEGARIAYAVDPTLATLEVVRDDG